MNLGIKGVDAGAALPSLPVTHWGSLCFLSPQIWALQDWRLWSPHGAHSCQLQLLPGHFGLLMPRNQQVRRGITVWAGIIDPH